MSFSNRTIAAAFVALLLLACFVPVNGGSIVQSAYRIIENGGTALPLRTVINWASGATCVDNAGANRTDCTATGAGGGITSVFGNVGPTIPNLSGDCTTSGSSAVTCGGVGGVPVGPLSTYNSAGAFVPPTGMSSVNVGTNDVVQTLSDGSELLIEDRAHAATLIGRFKNLPSPPYTVSVCWDSPWYRADSSNSTGLALYDGTKLEVAQRSTTDNKIIFASDWNSVTSFSGQVSFGPDFEMGPSGAVQCQRVTDDGTSRYYWYSNSAGAVWIYPGQTKIGNTAFLTPTQVGYVIETNNGNFMRGLRVVHMRISNSVCGTAMGSSGDSGRYSFGLSC